MANWWEIKPEVRTAEQKRLCQRAYYRTLLASAEGRQVLFDMCQRAESMKEVVVQSSEFAMAQLWLDDFMNETIRLCGVTDLMAVIEAKERIAYRNEPPQQEQADLPEGFEE